MASKTMGVTPGGEEYPRDLEQEEEFLAGIFSNFDRSVVC